MKANVEHVTEVKEGTLMLACYATEKKHPPHIRKVESSGRLKQSGGTKMLTENVTDK
jgi:hypothetical protein